MLEKQDLVRAKKVVFQFLKTRNRSEYEIKIKLRKKKISQPIIEQTIQYFRRIDLINDQQFARDWISMRLRKPLGLRRIFFELKEKGISEEILTAEINKVRQNTNEEVSAEALARKRIVRYKDLDERTQKRRVFEYLARRGFNPPTIIKIVERL